MRRGANDILKSVRDQVRGVRYSLRAEASAPGSTLPKALHDLAPIIAIGSPALRLADGLATQVESLTPGFLRPTLRSDRFPAPVFDYVERTGSFSERLYRPYEAILTAHGVAVMLLSEQALDQAGEQFRARIADGLPRDPRNRSAAAVALACAGLARALVEARPVRKVTYAAGGSVKQHFLLSPNLFCGMRVAVATAMVSVEPSLSDDSAAVLDSVDSVVDVRFDRFNRALVGKTPEADLACEIEVLLPFLR